MSTLMFRYLWHALRLALPALPRYLARGKDNADKPSPTGTLWSIANYKISNLFHVPPIIVMLC
jgi:hypothetical protein